MVAVADLEANGVALLRVESLTQDDLGVWTAYGQLQELHADLAMVEPGKHA